MNFIAIAQSGFDTWAAKPHNAKWFRRIDGTPIPNDLVVCIAQAFSEARALSAAPAPPATGWQTMETAPFDTLVDLWCIQGYEREATWPVRGTLVGDRHKSKDYGWFGNQSKDGVPQGDSPDLVPVAWRPSVVPTELMAAFLLPTAGAES